MYHISDDGKTTLCHQPVARRWWQWSKRWESGALMSLGGRPVQGTSRIHKPDLADCKGCLEVHDRRPPLKGEES